MKAFCNKEIRDRCAKKRHDNALKRPSNIKAILYMDLLLKQGYSWTKIVEKLNEKNYRAPKGGTFDRGSANGLYLRFKRNVDINTLTI